MSNHYRDVKTTASVADAYRTMYATPNEDILNEELIDSLIEDVRDEEINEWLDYLEEDGMMSYPKKNEKKIRPMLMKVAKKHPRVKVSFGTHSKGKFVDDNNINFKGKDKDVDALLKDIQNNHKNLVKMMEDYELEEGKGLADKAKKSGISVGTLRKVYNRGMAAWKTGHRPGTTPQQWGMARVNAFIVKKKKGNLNHDKDLAHVIHPDDNMLESLKPHEKIISKTFKTTNKVEIKGIDRLIDMSSIGVVQAMQKQNPRGFTKTVMNLGKLKEDFESLDEVKRQEVDAMKKVSKEMQKVLVSYQKIANMGDKELKDTKHNKEYKKVLDARDTILKMIGTLNTKMILQKEELDNDDKPVVKKIVTMLKKASKKHAKQAGDLEKAVSEATLKVKYDGGFEKGRGPTGISYTIPSGHPDAENPRTRKKYPERQTPQYKKLYKAILKKKAPKQLKFHPISEGKGKNFAQQAAIAIAKKKSGKYDKDGKKINASHCSEGVSVSDERIINKGKSIVIMIDDNGKKVSAIFKDKKNADKFNRNKPSDVKKLLKLAKSKKFGKAIDEKVKDGKLDPLSKMGKSKLTGQEINRYYRENPKQKAAARDKTVKKAIELALDLSGATNYAIKEIEKLKRGLSKNPAVKLAIQHANESKEFKGHHVVIEQLSGANMVKLKTYGKMMAKMTKLPFDENDPEKGIDKLMGQVWKQKHVPANWERLHKMVMMLKSIGVKMPSLKGKYMGLDPVSKKAIFYKEGTGEMVDWHQKIEDIKEGIEELVEKQEMKDADIKKIEKMTDRNDHTGSLMHLAKLLGDRKGLDALKGIMMTHKALGHMPEGLMKTRNQIHDNLMRQSSSKYSNHKDVISSF